MNLRLRQLAAAEVDSELPALIALLIDAVDSGASVGFLPPLSAGEAMAYWKEVVQAVDSGSRILIAAFLDGELVGSAQVELATKANALHRAEIVKLLVHRRARRRGIARALMAEAERAAGQQGPHLLVLDTRQGDPSEQLYRLLGYREAGVIPRYARSASGELHGTVLMYRELN